MPPHCDALDGPVVNGARRALELGDIDVVLPFVPEEAADEIRDAFALALRARAQGGDARRVAETYFFETVVRLHRAGEGAPYTGLKPAGLDNGPIIPLAEKAIETGSAEELVNALCDVVASEVKERLDQVSALKTTARRGLSDARRYTSAMLGFQVYANDLFKSIQRDPHASHAAYEKHAG